MIHILTYFFALCNLSTMCRVLARDLNLRILEWNDDYSNPSSGISSSIYANSSLQIMPYQSQLKSFEDFLQSAGSGYNSLNINAVTKTSRKSNLSLNSKCNNDDSHHGSLVLIEEVSYRTFVKFFNEPYLNFIFH